MYLFDQHKRQEGDDVVFLILDNIGRKISTRETIYIITEIDYLPIIPIK